MLEANVLNSSILCLQELCYDALIFKYWTRLSVSIGCSRVKVLLGNQLQVPGSLLGFSLQLE